MSYWLGIDLGGTKIRAGITNDNGTLLSLFEEQTVHSSEPNCTLNQIISLGHKATQAYPISAAGICLPGAITDYGEISHATNLPFQGLPKNFKDILSSALTLPVFLENDANAAAYGEYLHGSGKGFDTMYYLTISTGIGGGFIWHGNIIHGASGFAGEVGSIIVENSSRSFRGLKPGAVEGCSSGSAVLEQGKKLCDPNAANAGDILKLAASGNHQATNIRNRMIHGLARILASITLTVDPALFVLGGSCLKSAELFMDDLLFQYRKLLPDQATHTPFHLASLQEPGVIGSAELAKKRFC